MIGNILKRIKSLFKNAYCKLISPRYSFFLRDFALAVVLASIPISALGAWWMVFALLLMVIIAEALTLPFSLKAKMSAKRVVIFWSLQISLSFTLSSLSVSSLFALLQWRYLAGIGCSTLAGLFIMLFELLIGRREHE